MNSSCKVRSRGHEGRRTVDASFGGNDLDRAQRTLNLGEKDNNTSTQKKDVARRFLDQTANELQFCFLAISVNGIATVKSKPRGQASLIGKGSPVQSEPLGRKLRRIVSDPTTF
ncbi:hypothetical protein Bbelb_197050 [Branchiostoma belcheri]|nr:hypothetical protein Bbelb_197050 [Branchiostoma belcheri]